MDKYKKLSQPFPKEALSQDMGRGFELTSIKAAYIIERLNEVFGLCGEGWRFALLGPEAVESVDGKIEYIARVAIQYRIGKDTGIWPVMGRGGEFVYTAEKGASHCWSQPVYGLGGSNYSGRGSVPTTDAQKGAITNALTKAASLLGVGLDVFKGQVRVGQKKTEKQKPHKQPRPKKKSPKKRPWPPEMVKKVIQSKIRKAKKENPSQSSAVAPPGLRGLVVGTLEEALESNEERYAVTKFLINKRSSKPDVDDETAGYTWPEAKVLVDWLTDEDGKMTEQAAAEARKIVKGTR